MAGFYSPATYSYSPGMSQAQPLLYGEVWGGSLPEGRDGFVGRVSREMALRVGNRFSVDFSQVDLEQFRKGLEQERGNVEVVLDNLEVNSRYYGGY